MYVEHQTFVFVPIQGLCTYILRMFWIGLHIIETLSKIARMKASDLLLKLRGGRIMRVQLHSAHFCISSKYHGCAKISVAVNFIFHWKTKVYYL